MELKVILGTVMNLVNVARSAYNSGEYDKCEARLADLSAFLIADGPNPVDKAPAEPAPAETPAEPAPAETPAEPAEAPAPEQPQTTEQPPTAEAATPPGPEV